MIIALVILECAGLGMFMFLRKQHNKQGMRVIGFSLVLNALSIAFRVAEYFLGYGRE